jgi:hypothetical protein
MRRRLRFAALGIFVSFSGCITSRSTVDTATRDRILSVVQSGRVNIVCGIWCAADFSVNRARLRQYYTAGNWADLGILVIRINYRSDLAYYFLGAAAEGLNSLDAAIAYYETARAIAARRTFGDVCAGITDTCEGINFGVGLEQQILGLRSAMARRHIPSVAQPPPPVVPSRPSRKGALTDDDIIGR